MDQQNQFDVCESANAVAVKSKAKCLEYSSCVYTSCYCEENVWKLCHQIKVNNPQTLDEYYVVFISNKKRQVPLWMQKSSKDPLTPVVWDYHVILLQKPKEGKSLVYDLDSILAFPCSLEQYLSQAIQSERTIKKEYHRKFRIIQAEQFLATFASDRSHMKLPNGQYVKPPPNYPPIRTADEVMNLDDFIDVTTLLGNGRIKDLKGLVNMFGVPPTVVF